MKGVPALAGALVSLVALLASLSSCGYSLTAGAERMPPGAQRVFVRPFEARTSDADAGALVASALRQELARRGADAGPEVPARIEGAVEDTSFSLLNVNPPTYRLGLTVTARMVLNGKLLAEQRFGRSEDYLSGLDPLESEGRRHLALRRASEAIARDIIERFQQP